MAKSKRNLSRKRKQSRKRTTGKKRIVRLIRKIIGGATIESLKAIYDPEWSNTVRQDETKMEKAFYDKQDNNNENFKNVLIVGDETAGYKFADLLKRNNNEELTDNSEFLSPIETERRDKAGISTEPLLTFLEIQKLYNYLQIRIHYLYKKALEAVKNEEAYDKDTADNRI
jgi:hypothetical protein